ncbi:MAG TPA: DUF5010 domain-containing protein [Polyangiaceae bacterium]|nr:DUF5010 domain-containing protein [Polyangiaceae bacterium]
MVSAAIAACSQAPSTPSGAAGGLGGVSTGGTGGAAPQSSGMGGASLGGASGQGQGGSFASAGLGGTSASGAAGASPSPAAELRPEFSGPCARADRVDVNLGNAPEAFVRAAYCQVQGSEPSADIVSHWSDQLRTVKYVRRVDVVRTFCNDANRSCALDYSNPWSTEPELTTPCARSGTRDMGALQMLFFNCPGGVNCGMDWANTHADGMATQSPLLGFGAQASGYYDPRNPGFWRRNLIDAGYAGLQFLMLNIYGPDLTQDGDPIGQLDAALDATDSGVKIALFDDTSGWGNFDGVFANAPSLNDSQGAAQAIYDNKWKPFFTRIARKDWYLFNGRPFIYFYNGGTLQPQNRAAATVKALRALFLADFGVSPFVVVDQAFFDDPDMPNQADSRFVWYTFGCDSQSSGSCVPGKFMSESTLNNVKLDGFMVRWDTLGRDNPGQIAGPDDHLDKDESLLQQRLIDSASAQIAVVATWNDLGEGTGIGRNYDYYVSGRWLDPLAFAKDIRTSQCSN